MAPPWFINLWFYAPHNPVRPAARFAQQYPDSSAGRYRALVNQLDGSVESVLEALEKSGRDFSPIFNGELLALAMVMLFFRAKMTGD